jgi:hypothetical protein
MAKDESKWEKNGEDEDLNMNWIEEFEKDEEKYSIFYPDNIEDLTVSILYINNNKELEKISEKKIKLDEGNKIHRNELITLIKQNERMDKQKYKVLSILIYNFSLQNDELKNFLRYGEKYDFLTNLKHIDTYEMDQTINCLHDINNLFILFYEDLPCSKNSSKQTKRVKFNLIDKKTRRRK